MLSVDHRTAVDPVAPVDLVAPVDPVALEKSISSATEALLEYRQSDGHWVFELEADSTIPSEYVLLRHYLAEPVDSVLEAKIANYLRRTQGDAWRLGAGAGRPVRHERQRQILFCAEDDRRFRGRAAHGARTRGDPQPRRRCPRQRLHPVPAGILRRADLARGAGAAGRDHAAADLVAVPLEQDFLLGAHHDRAADGDGGAEAAGEKSQRRRHRRVVPAGSQIGGVDAEGAASKLGVVHALQRNRQDPACDRTAVSEEAAPARDRRRARLHRGTAQRRRRHGRDLSADGQYRHDVRGARQGAGFSAACDHPQGHRQAARDRRARGLLPAMCVAGVGHRADLPRAGGGRRRGDACEDEAGPRLAQAEAGARSQGRLGGEGSRCPSGRLGVPVQQRPLSRSRRHRRGRDGDGPRAPGLRQQ